MQFFRSKEAGCARAVQWVLQVSLLVVGLNKYIYIYILYRHMLFSLCFKEVLCFMLWCFMMVSPYFFCVFSWRFMVD